MAPSSGGLLLVGCGKMGGALLAGWIAGPAAPRPVVIVEPSRESVAPFAGKPGIQCYASAAEVPADWQPDVIVFATKPQVMDAVAPAYRRHAERGALAISVAAGKTIAYFAGHLGGSAAIVRTMPNTPAQVGRGVTVCCANAKVSAAQRGLTEVLLKAVGEVGWVEDEALIDAVTAVSGSGPAYVFLLAECMHRAGVEAGLPDELAAQLARATVAGAGELLHRSAESAATLRQNVTSPNGTTAAALAVLMAPDGLQPLMSRAVAAAQRRSRELAG
ncbi:MAG: pyrroline-5-carboxylate reductase [Alphaproteobacteria bacterium]|nr:pyrroline-5-carboxylate reductase [Alphaproteobacteria bacterium]